jgi:hypothetical protein
VLAFEDIIFVMAMSICNVMMATMGKLAVEISESVSGLLKETQRSRLFCDKCSYAAKRTAVNITFVVNFLIGLGVLLYLLITLGQYGYHNKGKTIKETLTYSIWFSKWNFNRTSGWIIVGIWSLLTLSLIYYYSCMVYTLNKSFS